MKILVWLFAALLAAPAWCSSEAPFLWKIRAADDSDAPAHWLLGSIHLLPASAHPLPPAFAQAYEASVRVVFESDISALESPALQAQMLSMAHDTSPRGLRGGIAPALYERLVEQLPQLSLPVDVCDAVQAWFCALMLELAAYQNAGFLPTHGVDRHFHTRAVADGKRIEWLEPPKFQLDLFTRMPAALGRSFLASALDGLEDPDLSPERLLRAWQAGDVAYLTQRVEQLRREHPGAYARLLADRNAAWRPPLGRLLRDAKPTLVIVGAAHLVGADSVIDALRADGFKVTPSPP